MEKNIKWKAKVGKKVFLENFKNPRKIFTLFTAFVCMFLLIFELAKLLEYEISVPKPITFFVSLLFLIFVAIYTYKTNKGLFRDEVRHYKIDSSGVTMNGKLYPWSTYKYFQDDSKLVENVSGMLPLVLSTQPIDRWLIQLLVGKLSDKNKLILVIDNKDIYDEVRKTLREKLKEASSIS